MPSRQLQHSSRSMVPTEHHQHVMSQKNQQTWAALTMYQLGKLIKKVRMSEEGDCQKKDLDRNGIAWCTNKQCMNKYNGQNCATKEQLTNEESGSTNEWKNANAAINWKSTGQFGDPGRIFLGSILGSIQHQNLGEIYTYNIFIYVFS